MKVVVTEKVCTRCGVCKPITEYYRRPDTRDGHFSYCRTCDYRPPAAWLAARKPRPTFWQRMAGYGVPDACWLWRGSRLPDGYGTMGWKGRGWRTHRLAWFLTHGDIPAGLEVCHSCDARYPVERHPASSDAEWAMLAEFYRAVACLAWQRTAGDHHIQQDPAS